jgi:hypothetical protein
MTLQRISSKTPGYDCIRNPCGKYGCGTNPGSSHGVHNEEWLYVVKDGDVAMSLLVGSRVYPETVPQREEWRREGPRGNDLTLHVGFPVDRDEIAGTGTDKCEFVSGGTCYPGGRWSTAIGADRFVKRFFVVDAGFEQPETFWRALEDLCIDKGKQARADRVDTKYQRCIHCDGTGTVRR